ncbi:class A beta-lactamase [Syntrophus buswellii]|jgi:beta-lactamase class A|uniref:class A beta-lactamase n=1 Tax=Syntrophus TaxID=43773 RepID=UPI0009D09D15|nr:MAG: Extended-spectrum beta-lactamase PER-1 precursor [Syntrophus sp. PtaB.Bin138]
MITLHFLKYFVFLAVISVSTVSCTVCKTQCPPSEACPPVVGTVPLEAGHVPASASDAKTREKLDTPAAAAMQPQLQERSKSTAAPRPGPEPERAQLRLEQEVKRLAALAGGTVGVSALHIESGRSFSFNGGERFPMASVYKIPIAVQLLRRVDRGEVRLNSTVTLRSGDIHPGSGRLIKTFKKKDESYSVRELLELMLLISDNTASDAILKLAGGPAAVTAAMKSLGIQEMDVSRPTLNMLADWRGISDLPSPEAFQLQKYNRLRDSVPADTLKRAQSRFHTDRRDTASPDAMTSLLAMVYDGTALQPETTSVLLGIMERCQTGNSRIKDLIPPGMKVANKTGTIGPSMVNDAAILTLPGEAGHVALAIFIKTSNRSITQQEQAMAQIARYLYDYYFFQGTDLFEAAANETCSLEDPSCSP